MPPFVLFPGRKSLHAVEDLWSELFHMTSEQFAHHTANHNDFAIWVRDGLGNPDLATSVLSCTSQKELREVLNDYFSEQQRARWDECHRQDSFYIFAVERLQRLVVEEREKDYGRVPLRVSDRAGVAGLQKSCDVLIDMRKSGSKWFALYHAEIEHIRNKHKSLLYASNFPEGFFGDLYRKSLEKEDGFFDEEQRLANLTDRLLTVFQDFLRHTQSKLNRSVSLFENGAVGESGSSPSFNTEELFHLCSDVIFAIDSLKRVRKEILRLRSTDWALTEYQEYLAEQQRR